MKMLIFVARDYLEDAIVEALKECAITHYTIVPRSRGAGETGSVKSDFLLHGENIGIFSSVVEKQADLACKTFKSLRPQLLKEHRGQPSHLRMFCRPCEQIL